MHFIHQSLEDGHHRFIYFFICWKNMHHLLGNLNTTSTSSLRFQTDSRHGFYCKALFVYRILRGSKNYVPKTSENDQGRSHQSWFLVCLCLFTSSRMRKRVNSSRSVAQTTYLSICPSQQKLLLSETNNAVSTSRAVCDASKYDS